MSDDGGYINPLQVKHGGLAVTVTLPSRAANRSGPMAEHVRRLVQVGQHEDIDLPLSEKAADRAAALYDELFRHPELLGHNAPAAYEPGAQLVELPIPDAVVERLGGAPKLATRLNQAVEAAPVAGLSREAEGLVIDIYRELLVTLDSQPGED